MKSLSGRPYTQVYFDHGGGFSEETSVRLRAATTIAYHYPLKKSSGLRQIRFDPSTSHMEFNFYLLHTRSALITGIIAYAINSYNRKTNANIFYRLVNMVRDVPAYLRRMNEEISSKALEQINELDDFVRAMSELSFRLRRRNARKIGLPRMLLSTIVPVYNATPNDLDVLILSFLSQEYSDCELIIADDGSISLQTQAWLLRNRGRYSNIIVLESAPNGGISAATNRGLAVSNGKWVSFMDHDDAFSQHALSVVKDALSNNQDASMFYTDEYIADGDLNIEGIFLKPSFDPIMLCGMNYINHFSIYRRDQIDSYLNSEFDGSQDYEFLLRYITKIRKGTIVHIPFPAYIWRRTGETYSARFLELSTRRARQAVGNFAKTFCPIREVGPALNNNLHKIDFNEQEPISVSVVIPNKKLSSFHRAVVISALPKYVNKI